MRWVLFLIQAGLLFLAAYVLGKYVVYPVARYIAYNKRLAEKRDPKTPEELKAELERVRLGDELLGAHLEKSRELEDHLDEIFSSNRPQRRKEYE